VIAVAIIFIEIRHSKEGITLGGHNITELGQSNWNNSLKIYQREIYS
jgi:hypothetical protein